MKDGAEAFAAAISAFLGTQPRLRTEVKRVIAEGDFVALHVHTRLEPEDRGHAVVDLFRLENGKIVEHWDVAQPVPERTESGRGMF